jgi:hypothetical protein
MDSVRSETGGKGIPWVPEGLQLKRVPEGYGVPVLCLENQSITRQKKNYDKFKPHSRGSQRGVVYLG